MPATIMCRVEIQDQIIERVISELCEALEPLDMDWDDDWEWDDEEDMPDLDLDQYNADAVARAVRKSVIVTDQGIEVDFPVDDVYCADVYGYLDSIVNIFKRLKAGYTDIAILHGCVYVADKYEDEYKHGYKFSCTGKDSALEIKPYM